MKAVAFFQQIKIHDLQSVYYLHGEELFAKEQAIDQLINTTEESVREFNVHRFDHAEAEEIIAACESWPMMDERKLIFVRDERYFGGSDRNMQMMIDYLPKICPTSCLVFDQNGQADARRTLYKAVDGLRGIVVFDRYEVSEAAQWAIKKSKQQNVELSMVQATALIQRSSTSLGELEKNIQKLCDYVGVNGTITSEAIEILVQPNIEYTVFEMLEYFLNGQIGDGLNLLHQTVEYEGAGAIFSMTVFFATRLRNMLAARMALDQGQTQKLAAQSVGGNAYAAKKSVEAARKFSVETLENALLSLADLDYGLKTGRAKGIQALEMILLKTFIKA